MRTTGSTEWLPLLAMRRPAEERTGQVTMSDPINRRRAHVSIDALVDLLGSLHRGEEPAAGRTAALADRFRDMGWLGPELDERTRAAVGHWWRRGWHPSLSYYLWSRGTRYGDVADEADEFRRSAMGAFEAREGPPPPRVTPSGRRLELPPPARFREGTTLGDLLLRRRTIRAFRAGEVEAAVLASILDAGLDDVRDRRRDAGTDYLRSFGIAFDVYVVVYRVAGVPPGAYLYDVLDRALVQVSTGLFDGEFSAVVLGMPGPGSANVTVVLAADFPQYQWRYRHERALRNLYIASGRVAQRLILTALAHGLGTLPTPATRDRDLCRLLALDERRQAPIYTLTMGLHGPQTPAGSPGRIRNESDEGDER